MAATSYQCKYCEQRFVHENRYIRHRCKQMKREAAFQQPIGQTAWVLYQKWMRSYKKEARNAQAFLNSRYYNSFMKFAEFVKQVKLIDIDLFVAVMRQHDIAPTIWTNDQVYSLYIEHIDKKLTPEQHAEITVNNLFDIAEDNEVLVEEIFDTLTVNQLIQMLRERRLSPWILLNSKKFSAFFNNKTTLEQRMVIETIIRPKVWKDKFANNPEIVKQMKVYVNELNL